MQFSRYTPKFLRGSRTPPLTLARQKYGRPTLQSLQDALKDEQFVSFLIVRHPLERLLSAYRDKIQHAVSGSVHFKLGRNIIRKYRKKVSDDEKDVCVLRFFPNLEGAKLI